MKISERTLKILLSYSKVNPSICINSGNIISTMSKSNTFLSRSTIEETFDSKICIGDISRFANLLSLFGEYELDINETFVKIYDDQNEMRYLFCHEEDIKIPPKNIFDELDKVESELSFNLLATDMKKIYNSAVLLGINQIQFFNEDGFLYMAAKTNSKNLGIEDFYKHKIMESDHDFTISIFMEVFRLININNYTIDIGFIKDKPIIKFHNIKDDLEMDYWLTGIRHE